MTTIEWRFTPAKVAFLVFIGCAMGASATAWLLSSAARWGTLLTSGSLALTGGAVLASCRKRGEERASDSATGIP